MISFVPFVIRYRWAIGAGIILVLMAFFLWHYSSLLKENKRLNMELVSANTEISRLNDIIVIRETIRRDEDAALGAIDNAPTKYDGPIARVVLDAINGLSDNSR